MSFNRDEIRAVLSRRQALVATAGMACCALPGFGENKHLTISGGQIEVTLDSGNLDLKADAVLAWIKAAGRAVSVYFGHFPVTVTRVGVEFRDGEDGVLNGVTYGDSPPRTQMTIGQHTSAKQLDDDWTMTHEFIHLGFPSVPRRHHWIEEGIATYVEPIARVQEGALRAEQIWADMARDMHKGAPGSDDRGLDHTHTWGRTYWGGAGFCLEADVRIRERTGNRRGLQQALRGILAAGGTIEEDWEIERALQAGDAATGVPVLMELYGEMKDKPMWPDLDALLQRLGVERQGRTVVLHADAPLARVREAITRRPA